MKCKAFQRSAKKRFLDQEHCSLVHAQEIVDFFVQEEFSLSQIIALSEPMATEAFAKGLFNDLTSQILVRIFKYKEIHQGRMQKGQVSVFLVIGLFILLILSLLLSQYDFPLKWSLPTKANAVQQFISSCFSQSAQNAVHWFYAQDPERVFFPLIEKETVIWWPVWYDRGTLKIPQDPLSWVVSFATSAQRRCTDNFVQFPEVKQQRLEVTAEVYSQGVELTLYQPVVVENKELNDPYKERVSFRLLTVLDVALQLLTTIKEQPDKIPIDYMVELGKKNNVGITYAYLESERKTPKDIVVYQITDLLATTKKPSLKFIARME